MEGDKIIKTLKSYSSSKPVDLGRTHSAIKCFLSPLLNTSTCANVARYELFCLKCLKACVDVLVNSKNVPSGYCEVVDVLTDALAKCSGSNNKVPQLSSEKVLLHIVKEYCIKKCYNEQLKIAQLLQTLLRKSSTSQVISIHNNVTDLLWKAASKLENNLLCLQFRLTAILSMIDAKCSGRVVIENIIKCSSWYQLSSPGSCDLLAFYNVLDQHLLHNMELGPMSLFLCHYCKVAYDSGEELLAEECLKRLSRLSIDHSTMLEGVVIVIQTCRNIQSSATNGTTEESKLTDSINKAVKKLNATRESVIESSVVFVMEWLNKLLTTYSPYTNTLLTAIVRLQEQQYIPYVCEQRKIIVYRMLLNWLFTQVKFSVEADGPVDDKSLQLSTELALSLGEVCYDKLGGANEHGCLGNLMFNIGLALSRVNRYIEACSILSMACKLLQLSCHHQIVLIHKVQLASKYHLLYNCQRKAGYHDDALDTLVMEVNCISIKQLQDDGLPSHLLTSWVKTCCTISSHYRSIVDVLQPRPSDHVITAILEAELVECRRHGSVEAWHDAIIRLGKWYKDKGCGLLQARLLVERAEWCLYHGSNSLEYCNEALVVLDGCHSNTEWHYCRGLAYLWLGVCQYVLTMTESCDTGSCDLGLVTDAIFDGLTEWEGITMETRGIDYYHSYQLLQTILHLSSLLLEFNMQLRVLNIMMNLTAGNHGDWMERAHIDSLYQYCDVLIGLNISSPLPSWQHDCPMKSSSCDHINILLIRCKHHMMQGEISEAIEVLEYVMKQHHKDYCILAETKMLYSRLLQYRNPTSLLSSQSLLDHVRHAKHTSPTSFKATSLELLLEALQLLRMLCKDVQLKPNDDDHHGWLLLGKLLECLYHVITILCWHGNCREAIYYHKEADSVCVKFNLHYWRGRFMNLMCRLELTRGQSPFDVMATMSTILCHSLTGNSLVCKHVDKQCWRDNSNPYYLTLMCHMIFCHTYLFDDIIPLIDLANEIAAFATGTCSKQLKIIMGSNSETDLSHVFKWVELMAYVRCCRHLIDIGDLSSAISLPTPTMPTKCYNPDDAVLWAELSLLRGVALAESALEGQVFLRVCWCYRSNIKLHKVCVTNKKRPRDVLADSSPEPPHPSVAKQWTEEDPDDDIMFRSDKSTSFLRHLEPKVTTKAKCKGGRGKKLNKKSYKHKVVNQSHPQSNPPGICSDELWPAVEMFLLCYQLCHPVCYSMLLRDVCLWIATCIGHHDDKLTAYFIHRSHGNMLHHKMVELCRKKYQLNSNNYKSFDTMLKSRSSADKQPQYNPCAIIQHVLQWGSDMLPPTLADFDWLLSELSGHAIVSLNISPYCSPTHLLICRVQHNSQPLLHCVTTTADSPLGKFNEIISQAKIAASSTEKATFWRRRRKLNQDLEDLLATVERAWLGVWKILLLGDHLDETALQDASEELLQLVNSANRKGSSNGRGWLQLLINSIEQLSNLEVDEFLTTVTMGTTAEAETLSVAHMREIHKAAKHINSIIMSSETERKPITILLGRLVHQFPWEQLPTLQMQPITRMPSLPVIVAHYVMLGRHDTVTVDTGNCYYMLNPSGNLDNTEKMFSKWFNSEPGWTGVVGKVTNQDHMETITKHQMFIYCGHGGGQEYLHYDSIQRLHNMPTSFLIGCSSGQLVEVGNLDPTGTVLSYLMAASPAVIANLWDVTDVDTDRFCHALLQSWLQKRGASLISMVMPSRQHCKLPCLVGGAAVMYGFPFILNSTAHSFR